MKRKAAKKTTKVKKSDYDLLMQIARTAMKYTCARYDDFDEVAAVHLHDLEIRLSTLPKPLHDKVSAKDALDVRKNPRTGRTEIWDKGRKIGEQG